MQPARRGASMWTIIATVAGAVGAAAAVYPLVFSGNPQFVHLAYNNEFLYADTLGEPVMFTGNWHIKRIRNWWWDEVVVEATRNHRVLSPDIVQHIKDKRVPALYTTGRTLLTSVRVYAWADDVQDCRSADGNFKLGLEFKGKSGTGWAYVQLPICTVPYKKLAAKRRAAKERADIEAEVAAKAAKAWKPIDEFLASACKDEANRKVCSEFSLDRY